MQPPASNTSSPQAREQRWYIVSEIGALDKAWAVFSVLYHSEARDTALRATCPLVHAVVGITLLRDMGTMIDRLFDPAQTRVAKVNRWNVSVHAFLKAARAEQTVSNSDNARLDSLLQACEAACEVFSEGRNKLLGHLDFETVSGRHAVTLPLIGQTEQAIQALRTFVDESSRLLGYSPVDWTDYSSRAAAELDALMTGVLGGSPPHQGK